MEDIYKGEVGECSICKNLNVELCNQLVCRDCHVSLTWEDCMDGSDNVAISLSVVDSPERRGVLKRCYPDAKQWSAE